jgi:hypothetical protein
MGNSRWGVEGWDGGLGGGEGWRIGMEERDRGWRWRRGIEERDGGEG